MTADAYVFRLFSEARGQMLWSDALREDLLDVRGIYHRLSRPCRLLVGGGGTAENN